MPDTCARGDHGQVFDSCAARLCEWCCKGDRRHYHRSLTLPFNLTPGFRLTLKSRYPESFARVELDP